MFRTCSPQARSIRLLALAFAATLSLAAPPQIRAERPKIGLALSGGGAIGSAHIGVLRALEELHIPIDYIAGTSMGAVVGGLYASGMSPEEIDDWVRHADWYYLLSDTLPRESESLRTKRQQYDINQGISLKVSRTGEVKLPAGLINGRNVMASLRVMTVPVQEVHDFSRLPIPFRAMATDIETGELVELHDGDLVDAIRASMSLPAIFTPHRLKGRMLVDGGLVNNFPIDAVQKMGADIVIAVDVSEPLAKAGALDTAPAIANQMLSIFMQQQRARQLGRLGPGDALIKINLSGYAPTDFQKAGEMIDAGYEQALKQRGKVARYSMGPAEYQRFLARHRLPRGEPLQFTFIRVQTPEGERDYPLNKPVEFTVKHHEQAVRLQNAVNDLRELQKYEAVDYHIIQHGGRMGLQVDAKPKKVGYRQLDLGFDFGASSAQETTADFLLSYRMTELNSLGAEWNNYLSFGDRTRVMSEWYQPVDWERRWFIAAQGLFLSDFVDGRDADGDPLRFRQQDRLAGLDVGMRIHQTAQVRVGYARGSGRISRRLGVPDEVRTEFDRGFAHADLIVDTLDQAGFATRGTYAFLSTIVSRQELGASDNYTRIFGQFYQPITFGPHTIVPRVSASVRIGGGAIPLYDQLPLGGFLNLSGLPRGTLFGENSALAELVYYRKLAETMPGVGRGFYGGFSLEAGEVWTGSAGGFDPADITFAGSIFVGTDTFLGPLFLGFGVAEGGDTAFYLKLAPLFGQGRFQR